MKQRGSMRSLLIGLVVFVLAAPVPVLAAVSVSGFVQTELLYSDKIHGSQPPRVGAAATPLDTDKDRDNSQFSLDARKSRLRVTWTDDVTGVKMSGNVEVDFATTDGNALTSNSRHPRLRYAYARADHPTGWFLLAGQYDSIAANEDIAFLAKYTIDFFNSPVTTPGPLRQPQVRVGWKTPLAPGLGALMLEGAIEKQSVENLGSAVVDESQGEGQTTPLLGGRATWDHPVVRLQAALAVAENTVILGNPPGTPAGTSPAGKDESDSAWAFVANTEIKFPPVTVYGHFVTQKGFGRLVNGDFRSAALTAANKVENIESTGFYVGAALALTPQTQLSATYGWEEGDENAAAGMTGTALETLQSFHLTLRHRFWKSWLAGLEYRRFWVETFSGVEGDVNHLALTLFYFF